MQNEEYLKVEKEFINLLLRFKVATEDWTGSVLAIDNFDPMHHKILYAIIDSIEKDVLLTRATYIEWMGNRYSSNKQEAVAQEILFNKIYMLRSKIDDYPMLRDKVLDSYLWRSTAACIKQSGHIRDSKGIRYAIADLGDKLQSLSENARQEHKAIFENVTEYGKEIIQYIEDVRSGKIAEKEVIKCGISEIDYSMTIGFAPGTLTLFCADVGSFKSTMMLNVGLNVWKQRKKNVLFVPLEMPREQMFYKMLARETEINFDKFLDPKLLSEDEVTKYTDEIKSWDEREGSFYYMEYMDRTKVSTIRREIDKHIDIFKPDLVIVDYIANLLPDTDRNNRNDLEIGDMLKDLRHMGRHMGFAVVSGAQLGREALKRIRKQSGDKLVAYSEDIRGSHEYSADADFMFVLMPDPQQPSSLLHLIVLKSRYGKKVFQDGRAKASLEVRPEISLIKSREDVLLSVNPEEVLKKAESDDLDFDEGIEDVSPELVEPNNDTDDIFKD